VTLGLGGTLAVAVLAFVALQRDLGDGLPVPLRFAAAALPFMAIAGLQWPGAVRLVTAAVLGVTLLVVGVPRVVDASRENREALVTTEIGTTAHPWTTRVTGLHTRGPQETGSGYLWTTYLDEDETPVVHLLRMPDEAVPGGDPCTGGFYTPEGDFPVTTCGTDDGVTWRRAADRHWVQLVRRVDGTWLGATARPDVPESRLTEALDSARVMDDEDYEAWLDTRLPSSPGY
jgi:hypothetical protein